MSELTALLSPPDDYVSQRQALAFLNETLTDAASETVSLQLQSLLDRHSSEQAALHKKLHSSKGALDQVLINAKTSISALLHETAVLQEEHNQIEDEFIDYRDELISSLAAGASQKTLLEQLEGLQSQIQNLQQVKAFFELMSQVEAKAIAVKQAATKEPIQAFPVFTELSNFVKHLASNAETQAAAEIARKIAFEGWQAIIKSASERVISASEKLNWPNKIESLDFAKSTEAQRFRTVYMETLSLEKFYSEHGLFLKSQEKADTLYAIEALAQPLVLRFRYHFDGKRQTNRLDKPEWYFSHVLNSLAEHEQFVRTDVQQLVNSAGIGRVNAMDDFITAMLAPVARKIQRSMPQLLTMAPILAHTIYQALQFDSTLKEKYDYKRRITTTEDSSLAGIILSNEEWFDEWINAEKKFFEGKYFEIIGAADAWQINEDITEGNLKPTTSAVRVRDLIDQIIDRYRPLPQLQHRLPFLVSIQLPILDGYLSRLSSAVDAFEGFSFGIMRAVPGTISDSASGKATAGLNGLVRLAKLGISSRFLQHMCKSWQEDVFLLDLWQEIKDRVRREPSMTTQLGSLAGLARKPDSLIFESYRSAFDNLSERIDDLIARLASKEITSELKPYLAKRWDITEEEQANEAELSSELLTPLTSFTAMLQALNRTLPLPIATQLSRKIVSSISDLIIARVLTNRTFTEIGANHFKFDVAYGWLEASRQACMRKPDLAWKKLLEGAILMALPAEAKDGGASFAQVMKVVWDADEAAYKDAIGLLGVKSTSQREAKAILRKRPECWKANN